MFIVGLAVLHHHLGLDTGGKTIIYIMLGLALLP